MRKALPETLERGRISAGTYGSDPSYGLCGAFRVQGPCGAALVIVADDGHETGWEHVSVSCRHRIPNWLEMTFVKKLFWDDDETVVQFHPPKTVYINCHPNCLHLWADKKNGHRLPPAILVGPDLTRRE